MSVKSGEDHSDAFVKTIQRLDIDSKTAPVVNKSTETSNDDKDDNNLQDWEDDLNLAWKALSDKQRDQLRVEQRSWIKYKDSLPLAKKIEAIKKRCHYLWPLSGN